MKRDPAVSGQFYPGRAEALRRMLAELIPENVPARPAIGLMAPHAGYIYSGAIAGRTFAEAEIPEKVVLLGPNHHGRGHPAALFPRGSWVTPLGEVTVDGELATHLLRASSRLAEDVEAHRFEHSLEVQLPFLQTLNPRISIVPICLGFGDIADLLTMGEELGEALSARPEKILLVASSDMTHYEPGEIARRKDHKALDRILDLDPAGLYKVVRGERISMCGVVPVVVMLAAARRLGAATASLVCYGNSGDVTGDQSEVVGYAGVAVR